MYLEVLLFTGEIQMATYVVNCSVKDPDGDIVELGVRRTSGRGQWTGRKSSAEAIEDIESGDTYHVINENGPEVIVVDDPDGKYLRSDPDAKTQNNLDNLSDCGPREN